MAGPERPRGRFQRAARRGAQRNRRATARTRSTQPPTSACGSRRTAAIRGSCSSTGLPDAAVLDLQIHQGGRLLRAALHGRGVYEYKLDSPSPLDTELYVRDTTLDVGTHRPSTGSTIRRRSPPPPSGTRSRRTSRSTCPRRPASRRRRTQIDFYQFNDKITDGSGGVATMDATAGTVTNRVYVEVPQPRHPGGGERAGDAAAHATPRLA